MLFVFLILLFHVGTTIGFYFITPDNPWMLFLWVILGFISAIILFFVVIFAIIYPLFRLTKPQNKLKHALLYQFSNFVNIIFRVKITVEGKENIPNDTYVVFGNHKSMLDIFIIYSTYHKVMSAIAKNNLEKSKVLRNFMDAVKVIPLDRVNERQGVKDLLKAIKLVNEGYNFIIFPEGGIKTRETELIQEIKPGAFKLATKPGVIVSPVSIIGSSACSKRSPWKKTKVKIIVHKPIYKEEYEGLTTHELGEQVKEIINQGVLNG